MIEVVDKWLGEVAPSVSYMHLAHPPSGGLGHSKVQETIGFLSKAGVREGKNKREGESPDGHGSNAGYSGGYSTGRQTGGSYGGGSTQQSKTRVSFDAMV